MSTVDISKNYRQYSPEQLRNWAYGGILECKGFDLSDFLEYFLEGYLDKAIEEAREEGYDSGFADGQAHYELPDEVVEQIRKAIKILEDI